MAHNLYSAPQAHVADALARAGSDAGPRGIGGWLILPLLGLVFTPLRVGFTMARDLLPVLEADVWASLTVPGSAAYHPLWAPLIVFELVANGLIIALGIALLVVFLKKSPRVPGLMIAWMLGLVAVQALDLLLAAQIPAVAAQDDPQATGEFFRSIVSAAIWIPYFMRSKRVRNTFVERG